jgi:hypothetical protein
MSTTTTVTKALTDHLATNAREAASTPAPDGSSSGAPPPGGEAFTSRRPTSLYRRAAIAYIALRERELICPIYEKRGGAGAMALATLFLGGLLWLTWLRPVPLLLEADAAPVREASPTAEESEDGDREAPPNDREVWHVRVPKRFGPRLAHSAEAEARPSSGGAWFTLTFDQDSAVVEDGGFAVATVREASALRQVCGFPLSPTGCALHVRLGDWNLFRSFRSTSALE